MDPVLRMEVNLMAEFKVGDIVQLKSGGPKMTIDIVLGDGELKCQWFAGDELQEARFDPAVIQLVVEEQEDQQ